MPFINLKDVKENEIATGYLAKFIHTQNMTFSHWDVKAGSVLPEHTHPHEQISIMIEGRF